MVSTPQWIDFVLLSHFDLRIWTRYLMKDFEASRRESLQLLIRSSISDLADRRYWKYPQQSHGRFDAFHDDYMTSKLEAFEVSTIYKRDNNQRSLWALNNVWGAFKTSIVWSDFSDWVRNGEPCDPSIEGQPDRRIFSISFSSNEIISGDSRSDFFNGASVLIDFASRFFKNHFLLIKSSMLFAGLTHKLCDMNYASYDVPAIPKRLPWDHLMRIHEGCSIVNSMN